MSSYLVQVSYTSSAVAALVANPQDRAAVVREAVEKLGGKMGPFYMCFGEYDTVGIIEMPDNVAAAAFALAIAAGGSCSDVKTTPLFTQDESVAAARKAATSGYKPVPNAK